MVWRLHTIFASFCKKKCFFMQKYLHMSNIYCIFAVRLGTTPRTTIKYLKLMNGACIFKACVNGRVYRVMEESIPHFAEIHYRLYVGRRLYQGINCFCDGTQAIESLQELIDFESKTLKMEGRV